jgi:hypothetical protein
MHSGGDRPHGFEGRFVWEDRAGEPFELTVVDRDADAA